MSVLTVRMMQAMTSPTLSPVSPSTLSSIQQTALWSTLQLTLAHNKNKTKQSKGGQSQSLQTYSIHSTLANSSTSHDRKINRSKCKWEVAPIRNFFNRDTDLMRHIKHIHVSPRTYSCNINRCRKSCSRKGNLMQHIRTHQKSHRAQLDLVNGSSVE
ncbi:hypothetical protein AWENTII_002207 [Aspergillus wentii]